MSEQDRLIIEEIFDNFYNITGKTFMQVANLPILAENYDETQVFVPEAEELVKEKIINFLIQKFEMGIDRINEILTEFYNYLYEKREELYLSLII